MNANAERSRGAIHLLAVGEVNLRLLQQVSEDLAEAFGCDCRALATHLNPEFALHPTRQQYYSTEVLGRMRPFVQPGTWRLLGVTELDLYIPILTFVFGEAQVGDSCAIVSAHRLRQEFYGLPAENSLLRERLLKEAVHELGHTLHLPHCDNYGCVMAPSHAVEWIDLKGVSFCRPCWEHAVAMNSGA